MATREKVDWSMRKAEKVGKVGKVEKVGKVGKVEKVGKVGKVEVQGAGDRPLSNPSRNSQPRL